MKWPKVIIDFLRRSDVKKSIFMPFSRQNRRHLHRDFAQLKLGGTDQLSQTWGKSWIPKQLSQQHFKMNKNFDKKVFYV